MAAAVPNFECISEAIFEDERSGAELRRAAWMPLILSMICLGENVAPGARGRGTGGIGGHKPNSLGTDDGG